MVVEKNISVPQATLTAFLLQAANLPSWTVHRAMFEHDGQWFEIRRHQHGDLQPVALDISASPVDEATEAVVFQWREGKRVEFRVQSTAAQACRVEVLLPSQMAPEQRSVLAALLQAELDILQALLEHGSASSIPPAHWLRLQEYHLNMYQ